MAYLTASREDFRQDGDLIAYEVEANVAIHRGALVTVDSTGYLNPAAPTHVRVVGVAYDSANNNPGAAGAISARVQREGVIQLNGSGFTQANVGAKVYVVDDNTVTLTATSSIQVGVITSVNSATSVNVALTPAV